MSLKFIRSYYGVPAKRGAMIKYEGKRGVITGSRNAYVRARLDGDRSPRSFHPLDLDFLAPEAK